MVYHRQEAFCAEQPMWFPTHGCRDILQFCHVPPMLVGIILPKQPSTEILPTRQSCRQGKRQNMPSSGPALHAVWPSKQNW